MKATTAGRNTRGALTRRWNRVLCGMAVAFFLGTAEILGLAGIGTLAAGCAAPTNGSVTPIPHVHFDGGTCPSGTAQCGGHCVDYKSDNLNCGACGNACAMGELCKGGVCGMGGLGACPGMQTRCNGQCTDTAIDTLNCGICGVACAQDQTCMAGNCVSASTCAQGQTNCAGTCTDLAMDNANCGSCGNACPQGKNCQASMCTAQAMMGMGGCNALVKCLNNCMDNTCQNACVAAASAGAKMLFNTVLMCLDTACPRANGGVCDKTAMGFSQTACDACFSGAQQMGGKCSNQLQACLKDMGGGGCAQGQTSCNGVCVNTSTDVANCGVCGNACAQGQTCKTGQCSGGCVQGQTSCNGVCKNLKTDAANCGACGKACLQGQTCQNGVCAGGMMGGMTGCAGAVSCLNNCNDSTCDKACVNNTTQMGVTLLQALFKCLDTACPSKNAGVCDSMDINYDPNACNACYAAAQSKNGQCVKQLNACTANGP